MADGLVVRPQKRDGRSHPWEAEAGRPPVQLLGLLAEGHQARGDHVFRA